MIIDQYIDNQIGIRLLEQNKKERENHKSSGKLSAGMLGKPLQWQILKMILPDSKEFDEYTLRKFLRGKQIEEWLITQIPAVVDKQKFVEYRECVGYVDVIVDTKDYNYNFGIIPHEVKSVANAKFKRIIDENKADKSHKLQAGLYALALGKEHFAIDYVASDDLRVKTFVYDVLEVKSEIDEIIKVFYETLRSGIVPVFQPNEKWQENEKYQDFPEWSKLTQEQINEKIKNYDIPKNNITG
jgi:hypothetical protein